MTAPQFPKTTQEHPTKHALLWRSLGAATAAPFGITAMFQMANSAETTTEIPGTPAPGLPAPAESQNLSDPVTFGVLGTAVLLIGLSSAVRNKGKKDNIMAGFSLGMLATVTTLLGSFAVGQLAQNTQDDAPATKTEISAEEVIASQPSQQQATAPTTYIYQP